MIEEIAAGVFVETGYEGVNVGVVATAHGLVCIDAPSYPHDTRHWATQVDRLNSRAPRYLILTDCQADRAVNARWLNAPVVAHQAVADRLSGYDKRYPQAALEGLYTRYRHDGRDLANGPVERPAISFSRQMAFVLDDVEIHLLHRPGPMAGSIWVHLPEQGVLFTGDSVVRDTFPATAELRLAEWLDTIDRLADPKLPAEQVIPGRGPRGGKDCADGLAHILRDFRDTARDYIDRGISRERLGESVSRFLVTYSYEDLTEEWLEKQIRVGLERAYDELLTSAGSEAGATLATNGAN